MSVKIVPVVASKGTMETDLCARSGLTAVGVVESFSTVYTMNFSAATEFYKRLLGSEQIKFETDAMVVFDLGVGQVLLQSVEASSVFAKLAGHQSLSFAVPKVDAFLEKHSDLAARLTDASVLGWTDTTRVIEDPEGNLVILADATPDTAVNGEMDTLEVAARVV